MKKEHLNVEELNNVINKGSKILNLFYILMIIGLIGLGLVIINALGILPILITILQIMSPFFIGFIFAWLLNPLINMLQDKGMKRSMAVVLVYLMLAVIIYLFCLAVIPSLITQLNEFAKMLPDYLTSLGDWVNGIFDKLSNSTNIDMENVRVNFMNTIENWGRDVATDLPAKLINIVQNVVSGIGKFLIGIIIGFYLSLNFNNVNKLIMGIVPKKFRSDAEKLLSSISEVLYKFLNGTLLLTILLFVVSVIGFSIIGLKTPILFALFCAVTNLIPYIGPYIGAVPAIAIGFTQDATTGILVAIFIAICQTIDGNILHPIVIGKQTDLHPVTIIVSLLIFEYFFGIIGMIIATPVVAVLKVIYLFLDEKFDFFGYAKEKNVKKEISKVKFSK